VKGLATFVFHDDGYCDLARQFADGLFEEAKKRMDAMPGSQRIDGKKEWQ
jgi:hypothetical protein